MVDLRHLLDDASLVDDRPALDPAEVVRVGRRRVRRRGLVRGGAALALVLVLGATAVTFRPWETNDAGGLEPVAPADPSPTPQPEAPRDVDTAPGTLLGLGQTAAVPVQHVGRGKVALTVTAVRRGDRADIQSLPSLAPSLRSSAARGEFWYVDVTITYRSGRIGGYYLDPDVEPVLSGGKQLGSWSITDHTFAPCPARGLPLQPEAGDSVDDCLIFQTQRGADVVGLRWGPFKTEYDVAGGDPVTWRDPRP